MPSICVNQNGAEQWYSITNAKVSPEGILLACDLYDDGMTKSLILKNNSMTLKEGVDFLSRTGGGIGLGLLLFSNPVGALIGGGVGLTTFLLNLKNAGYYETRSEKIWIEGEINIQNSKNYRDF